VTELRFSDLRVGDVIACPRDGLAERVTSCRPYVTGKVTIRTSRHDHFKARTALVAVLSRKPVGREARGAMTAPRSTTHAAQSPERTNPMGDSSDDLGSGEWR
jgi:hypothetical protein